MSVMNAARYTVWPKTKTPLDAVNWEEIAADARANAPKTAKYFVMGWQDKEKGIIKAVYLSRKTTGEDVAQLTHAGFNVHPVRQD